MPETVAAIGVAFGGEGAAVGAAELGAGAAAGAAGTDAALAAAAGSFGSEAALGGLGAGLAGDAALGTGIAGGLGEVGAGAALGAGIGAGGEGATGGGLSSADTGALYGPEGYGAQASPAELGAASGGANFFQQLSNIFTPGSGGSGGLFGKAGQGLGLVQVLSSLYGFDQSKKLQKASSAPGMTAAGLQAVQRSMAAQGYQGSGNMAAALERYGAQTNVPNIPGATAGITGQLSSLGLLTAGIPKLAGWGQDTPVQP